MVPQVHEPGREAEVDFGEFWAVIAGVMVKLWLFSLRLCCSGRACHRAFATQAQEAFFAGHVDAFDRLGGVPGRIRYDNLKPAVVRVLLGRDRIESERFVDCCAATSASTRSTAIPASKGRPREGRRRGRHRLVPAQPPRPGAPWRDGLAELNEMIAACDDADLSRVIEGHRATIAAEFAVEAPLLAAAAGRALRCRPARHGPGGHQVPGLRAPVPLLGAGVAHRPAPGGRHRRRGDHDRRTGAPSWPATSASCTGATSRSCSTTTWRCWPESPALWPVRCPLAARASGAFSAVHDAYWAAARRQLGDAGGTRALIAALLLARSLPAAAVLAGMRAALELSSVAPEVVAVEARRAAGERSLR